MTPDADAHTLTISDNGLGMNKQDLMENLGTIAQSGTKAFLEKLKESQDADSTDKDLIGQFGVGFYSAFMVADKVTVVTRKAGEEQAYKWESTGDGEYSLEECQKPKHGTTIILSLGKDFYGDDSEENYTDKMTLQSLVKKYSDYIRYPITMTSRPRKNRKTPTARSSASTAPRFPRKASKAWALPFLSTQPVRFCRTSSRTAKSSARTSAYTVWTSRWQPVSA